MVSQGFAPGYKRLLPLFRFDVAEKTVVVCVDEIILRRLLDEGDGIRAFIKDPHFHGGGSDINTKNPHDGHVIIIIWISQYIAGR